MSYYDEIAEGYEELHKEEQLKKLSLIKENMTMGNSILDVGCGTGFCLDEIKANRKVGIDPSKGLIEIGKKQVRNVFVGSAENIPFQKEEFETVISLTAAHHFDIKKGFNEIDRVCKGNFAFSVLKRSSKLDEIERVVNKLFNVIKKIEEDKDIIFICEKK